MREGSATLLKKVTSTICTKITGTFCYEKAESWFFGIHISAKMTLRVRITQTATDEKTVATAHKAFAN
jgi:hypothetical protein